MSAFAHVDSLRVQRIWEGVLGRSIEGDGVTLALVQLEPNATVPEHSHANEQLGIVVEGWLRFRIGEETRELTPGDTWCIGMHVPHAVEATAPEGAVLVEAFAPRREDWHALESDEPGRGRWP